MEIKTRGVASRLSRSEHVFLRENPHLKELFEKLDKMNISTIEDLKVVGGTADWGACCSYCGARFGEDIDKYFEHYKKCKVYHEIKNIMIRTEVMWKFEKGEIPYLSFFNHFPFQGNFNEAIPKIIDELMKL